MPLFSIIIPVYNVQNKLNACVKSVVEPPTKAARCATHSPPSCPA